MRKGGSMKYISEIFYIRKEIFEMVRYIFFNWYY